MFAFMDAQRTGWSAQQRRNLEDQGYLGMSLTTTAADCCASRTQPGAGNYNESASSAPRFEGGGSAVVAPRAKEGAAVATEMIGDLERAAFLLRNEPRAFGYKTADGLIQEGRTDAVIAYLESLAGGAAGRCRNPSAGRGRHLLPRRHADRCGR